MDVFKTGKNSLLTNTKIGCISHPYVLANHNAMGSVTRKEAYDQFVNLLYAGTAVVGNGRVVMINHKVAYSATLELVSGTEAVIQYVNWKKVKQLKHEFKMICGNTFKAEVRPTILHQEEL